MAREDYPEEEIFELSNGQEAVMDEHGFSFSIEKSVWEKKYKDRGGWEEDEDDPQKMIFSDNYLINVESDELIDDVKALCDYYGVDEEDLDI